MFIRRLWTKFRIRQKNSARSKFLRQVIPTGGIAAELGVHRGSFTRCILDISKPEKLHLVDPWYLSGKYWDWDKKNGSTTIALIGILRAFEDELVKGSVVLDVGKDLEVLVALPDEYFDWVYVDTTHQYEHTKKELDLLKLKVKADGIIAGDDWITDPKHRHHGVCRAVREFVEQEHYAILYASETDCQWAIRRDG